MDLRVVNLVLQRYACLHFFENTLSKFSEFQIRYSIRFPGASTQNLKATTHPQ